MDVQPSQKVTRQERLRWLADGFDHSVYFMGQSKPPSPIYRSDIGALFANDCMKILPSIKSDVVDTVFADPPFNLCKKYGKNTNDLLKDEDYISWCKDWLTQCVRVIKPGGGRYFYITCLDGMLFLDTICLSWACSFAIGSH